MRAKGGYDSVIPHYVLGTVWHDKTIIVIRWLWIAVHVVYAATSMLFVAGTIIYQHLSALEGQTWKSSSLAVLHALETGYKEQLGSMSLHSRLLARDYEQLARLSRTDEGGWLLRPPAKEDMQLDPLGAETPRGETATW